MTKAEIAEMVSKKMGFPHKDCYEFVDTFFEILKRGILEHKKVKLSGFGNFLVKEMKPRKWKSPADGREISIGKKLKLSFKPSPLLKKYINSSDTRAFNEWRKEILPHK